MVFEREPRKRAAITTCVDSGTVTISLSAFRQKYRDWYDPLENAGPVYRLPAKAIEGLQKPPAKQPPIMSQREADAERAFSELCRRQKALGVWHETFVCPLYLIRPDPLPVEMLRKLGWTPKHIQTAHSLVGKTDSVAVRLKGYVGWLLTEPAFIRGRDELASQWQALAISSRPSTLSRSLPVQTQPEDARKASKIEENFQQKLNAFLDLWGLTKMLTWDLPEPQGPLLPAPVAADAAAMPRHGLHIVLPIHYALTGTDDLLAQIRQQQVSLARDLGLDTTVAGLPHYEAYGQMLEIQLLELTIRSRYGKPGRRRGLVTVMEAAMAETLGRSVDQVQKLRKAITACRAGRRSSVRWLKVRD